MNNKDKQFYFSSVLILVDMHCIVPLQSRLQKHILDCNAIALLLRLSSVKLLAIITNYINTSYRGQLQTTHHTPSLTPVVYRQGIKERQEKQERAFPQLREDWTVKSFIKIIPAINRNNCGNDIALETSVFSSSIIKSLLGRERECTHMIQKVEQ